MPYLNYPLAISDGERLYGADEPRSEVVVRSFFQLGNCNPLIEGPLDVLALTDITPDDWPPPEPLELRIPEL